MMKSRPPQYDPILDSIADGVFTVDLEWNVTTFNRAAEVITGISRDDAVGRKCWEVFHTDICERDCLLRKTINTRRQSVSRTVHIVNSEGRTIPVSISTAMLKDAAGKVIGGVETFRDMSEIEELRKEISGNFTFDDIVTRDHRLLELFATLPVIARSFSPVLILGESGTGKELLAKAIHNASGRAGKPFVAVNCGALPENLLESELFGYKKGAFTDAKTDKPGRFDRARKGTLFLDEIADLPRQLQVKLLRVLQEKTYEPLGSTEPVCADVRIIAATNRDINAMVASGEFRQDLYYRINVIPVTLSPLRERVGDIAPLVEHVIKKFNTLFNRSIERLDGEAMAALLDYHYPGNVRELENIIQHAFVLCQESVIKKEHLPSYLAQSHKPGCAAQGVHSSIESFDRERIEEALRRNRYSRTKTADELGIHVATLWRKMKRYDISP